MPMDFQKLADAARTITPSAETAVRGIPDRDDWWVVTVKVGNVILVESSAGPWDYVIDEVLKKIKSMSQRMRAVLDSIPPPKV